MGMNYNMIPVTTGDFTYTLDKYEVLPEYTKKYMVVYYDINRSRPTTL